MPFIRGRYYINPTTGEALEKAREAEEAIAALQNMDSDESHADDYEWTPSPSGDGKGPIHRVEIETASLVPAHSGEATRGFVARIHRASHEPGKRVDQGAVYGVGSASGSDSTGSVPAKPETHAFSNDSDLVDFLRTELAKDTAQRKATCRQ